jgi:soluble lytic murein transglycosylase
MYLRKKARGRKTIYLFFFIIALLIIVMTNYDKVLIRKLYPVKFIEQVIKYSREYGLDPHLVFAVIKAESGFNPAARSHKDAMGLMQLTEGTAKWGASVLNIREFSLDDLYEPDINIRLGCWYLRNLLNEFNQDAELAIAAYNGGSGNVKKWLEDSNYSSSGKSLDKIPFRETAEYVKKVKKFWEIYRKLYNFQT